MLMVHFTTSSQPGTWYILLRAWENLLRKHYDLSPTHMHTPLGALHCFVHCLTITVSLPWAICCKLWCSASLKPTATQRLCPHSPDRAPTSHDACWSVTRDASVSPSHSLFLGEQCSLSLLIF